MSAVGSGNRTLLERLRSSCVGETATSKALQTLRQSASSWLSEHGLPTRKEECFRLLPLERLESTSAVSSSAPPAPAAFHGEGINLVLHDGVAGDVPAAHPGLRIRRIRDLLTEGDASWPSEFGKVYPYRDGFSAANTAGFTDGWAVELAPGVKLPSPIRLRVSGSAPGSATPVLPRLWLSLGEGSELQLIEHHHFGGGGPGALVCMVSEMSLQRGAVLSHVRLAEAVPEGNEVSGIGVTVAEKATYDGFLFGLGGGISRIDLDVRIVGEEGRCRLLGVSVAGAGECVDVHTRVAHLARRGTTREVLRAIAGHDGRVIFDGTIEVGEGASGTDAGQESRSLLLSPSAIIDVIPQLVINNDDVACSHGATIGSLDPEQLMYLRSRGLDVGLAREILVRAFVAAAVEGCPAESACERIDEHVAQLLTSVSKEVS